MNLYWRNLPAETKMPSQGYVSLEGIDLDRYEVVTVEGPKQAEDNSYYVTVWFSDIL